MDRGIPSICCQSKPSSAAAWGGWGCTSCCCCGWGGRAAAACWVAAWIAASAAVLSMCLQWRLGHGCKPSRAASSLEALGWVAKCCFRASGVVNVDSETWHDWVEPLPLLPVSMPQTSMPAGGRPARRPDDALGGGVRLDDGRGGGGGGGGGACEDECGGGGAACWVWVGAADTRIGERVGD